MNNITTISMGTGGILNYPAANGSPLTISYYHGYQEPIDLNLQTAATCIRCFSEGTSVLNNYDYTIIGGLFNTLQIGTNSGPTVYNLSVADTSVSTLNNLSGSGFQDQWSNSIVSATSGNTYAPSTSINNRGLANVLSGSLELYNGASYPAVFAQSGGSAFTFTNSGGLQWTNSSGVNTYTGAVVSPTLYGGNNATITYSGSQGGYTAGQYTLLSASNLAGGVSSGVVNASAIIVNDDTVNAPGSAVSWLNVFGNVGTNAWTASTAYGVGTNANNGGRIYQVTSAGTSAGSGGPSGTGSAITDGGVTWKYVSADFSGDRVGIQAELNILSPNDPATPNDSSRQWQAMLGTTTIHANQGGTGFNGNSAGFLYGGADQMWAYSGATYLSGVVGRETDVGIQTGASAVQRTGMQVVSFYNVRGNYEDDGYRLASVGGPGFSIGYEISGGSAYAISSTGTLFGYLPPEPGTLAGAGVSQVNPISALGVDLSGTEQTVAAIRTTGGTLITGAGVESIQSLKVSTSGTTVSVDAVGYELASATISNAGTGYNANDHLYEPVTGSIVQPVSVNGSGVISSLFVVTPGHYTGTAPTNPVTLLGGTGTGATAALSWTQATTLALSPSGGVTSVGGDFLANSASALATGATQGFLHLPHTTGAPTGTPANTTPGCEWNTSSHTLNCYDGSAWYHFTGTSGAG
jgi:hypothetical protein